MTLRLAILAAGVLLLLVGLASGRLLTLRQRRHLDRAPLAALTAGLLELPSPGPAVIAFSSPGCAACKVDQAPALDRLSAAEPSVRLVSVDVASQPEVARRFGILTVPSTVVLSPAGRVLASNHGFASEHRLHAQLQLAPGLIPDL